jgi:hypothetical protein
MKSFEEVGTPLMVIVRVAEVEVISNAYVAAGQPDPFPQSESDRLPMLSALAVEATEKKTTTRHRMTKGRTLTQPCKILALPNMTNLPLCIHIPALRCEATH